MGQLIAHAQRTDLTTLVCTIKINSRFMERYGLYDGGAKTIACSAYNLAYVHGQFRAALTGSASIENPTQDIVYTNWRQ